MKIYRIAFRNKFDIASNKLAKQVQQYVIKLYESGRLFDKKNFSATTSFRQPGFNFPISVILDFNVINNDSDIPFNIGASLKSSIIEGVPAHEASISIKIYIFHNFSEKYYNAFYLDMINIVRHELEHFYDAQKGTITYPQYDLGNINRGNQSAKAFVETFMERAKYLMDASEQVPFIRGLMLKAKKMNKSVKDMVQDYIQNQLFGPYPKLEEMIRQVYPLESKHIEDLIINLYMKRIETIFPNAKELLK